jgi:hypothetical protein
MSKDGSFKERNVGERRRSVTGFKRLNPGKKLLAVSVK